MKKSFKALYETEIAEQVYNSNAIENNTSKRVCKTAKISHFNLLNKAYIQTIEAFLEKGVWEIGI